MVGVQLTEVVYDDDVRMIEAGGRPRLLAESPQSIGISGERCRDQLDGNPTVEVCIVGLIERPFLRRARLRGLHPESTCSELTAATRPGSAAFSHSIWIWMSGTF
jgi:hypothetical protein